MREIRFRAWDIERKRMVQNVGVFYSGSTSMIWRYPDNKLNEDKKLGDGLAVDSFGIAEEFVNSKENDLYKLMQYTGLKDRTGKEIYDCDIIQSFCGVLGKTKTGKPELISWGEGEWLSGTLALNSYLFNDKGVSDFIEIIGNKFENPSLLEAAQ